MLRVSIFGLSAGELASPYNPPMPQAVLRFWRVLALWLLIGWTGFAQAQGPEPIGIVAFGTSFTHGRGVRPEQAFPARLEQKLQQAGLNARVLSMGVNGDTTSHMINRLHLIPPETRVVIYEFARGNDSRARISEQNTLANSDKIITTLLERRHKVLVVVRDQDLDRLEQRTRRYARWLAQTPVEIISIHQPPDKILGERDIWSHPTAQAHDEIAQSMLPFVRRLLAAH